MAVFMFLKYIFETVVINMKALFHLSDKDYSAAIHFCDKSIFLCLDLLVWKKIAFLRRRNTDTLLL